MEHTFVAQGATPEMLERQLWELQQRLESLGSAHESLVGYVRVLEERIEELGKPVEDLDLNMPPLSTEKVILHVTDRGRAKPDFTLSDEYHSER